MKIYFCKQFVGNCWLALHMAAARSESPGADDLATRMAQLNAAVISAGTRETYTRSNVRWLAWLFEKHPDMFTAQFHDAIGPRPSPDVLNKTLKDALTPPVASTNPPIIFDQIDIEKHFVDWATTLKNASSGSSLGKTATSNFRSALRSFYRDFDREIPPQHSKKLDALFKGKLKLIAKELTANGGELKIGKDPLKFDFYQWLCKAMLRDERPQYIFAHAMLVVSWNLMSRINNTAGFSDAHHLLK